MGENEHMHDPKLFDMKRYGISVITQKFLKV